MRRLLLSLGAVAVAASMTGCCCHHGQNACYAPQPSPCSPCGPCGAAPTYGAAPAYGPAPVYGAPTGGCPTGNCGAYPSGAFYGPTTPATAIAPIALQTAAVPMNPMPTY